VWRDTPKTELLHAYLYTVRNPQSSFTSCRALCLARRNTRQAWRERTRKTADFAIRSTYPSPVYRPSDNGSAGHVVRP